MSSIANATSAGEQRVRASRRQSVLVLELQHPARRNALGRQMLDELVDHVQHVDPHETAGIVLSGAGECFSAGANFSELTGTAADIAFDDLVSAAAEAVTHSPVPVVGVAAGPCMGAACELLFSCDVTVAEPSAIFQVPAVRLGLLYNPDAIAKLSRRFPDQTVRRLLVLAERFTATDAVDAGLVSTVQPRGSGVDWSIGRLTASWDSEAPEARTATKALLSDLASGSFDLDPWQKARRDLADSNTRQRRVAEAKARHGA